MDEWDGVRYVGSVRGEVEGVVVDQDGRPLPGVAVSLFRHGDMSFGDRWVGPESFWGWTSVSDAKGRFRCEGVPEGTYDVRPQQDGPAAEVRPGARGLRLVWFTDRLPGARADGPQFAARIVDAGGRPVALALGMRNEEWGNLYRGRGFESAAGVHRSRAWDGVKRATVEVHDAFDAAGRRLFLGAAKSQDRLGSYSTLTSTHLSFNLEKVKTKKGSLPAIRWLLR